MASNVEKKVTVSPYMMLNSWLRDGSLTTPIPEECLNGSIPQLMILNYFQSSPKYFVTINKLFNNFNLFALNIQDILRLMKELVYYTSYKPPFIPKAAKDIENKLCGILRDKFPYFRKEEISMVVSYIDKNPEIQEVIYEQFGIRNVKAKKSNKTEYNKKMKSVMSAQSLLESL